MNDFFDHTSVLSTVVNCFDLREGQLGDRQKVAPDIGNALTLSAPRTDRPHIPQPASSTLKELRHDLTAAVHREALLAARTKPVSNLQKTIVNGAANLMGQPLTKVDKIETVLQANVFLMEESAELLAKKKGH